MTHILSVHLCRDGAVTCTVAAAGVAKTRRFENLLQFARHLDRHLDDVCFSVSVPREIRQLYSEIPVVESGLFCGMHTMIV